MTNVKQIWEHESRLLLLAKQKCESLWGERTQRASGGTIRLKLQHWGNRLHGRMCWKQRLRVWKKCVWKFIEEMRIGKRCIYQIENEGNETFGERRIRMKMGMKKLLWKEMGEGSVERWNFQWFNRTRKFIVGEDDVREV